MSLEKFGISHRNGFLPDELPLQYLPNIHYQPWEVIARDIPALTTEHRIRQEIDNLPILSTSKLSTEREWQRAYILLSLFTHGYIWGGETPSEV
jgi:indoleamine 2,3-dioxygenase